MKPERKKPLDHRLKAKIHIAKKDLGWGDDFYRGILFDLTGKDSCGDMDLDELKAVLEHMEKCGWKPSVPKKHKLVKLRKEVYERAEIYLGPKWREKLKGLVKSKCGVDRLEWVRSEKKLLQLLAMIRKMGEAQYD